VFPGIFVPPLAVGAAPERFPSCVVLGVDDALPFTARDLGGVIGETVDGRVTCRNLHPLRIDIVSETADTGCLPRERKLQVALGECPLGLLALADVPQDLRGSDDFACSIPHR